MRVMHCALVTTLIKMLAMHDPEGVSTACSAHRVAGTFCWREPQRSAAWSCREKPGLPGIRWHLLLSQS